MYFSLDGYKTAVKKNKNLDFVLNLNGNVFKTFYEKNLKLMQFFEYDLKKNIIPNLILNKKIEIRRGKRGANIVLTFRFYRNNLRAVVYLENYGYILYSTTGGIVAKKVLATERVYRRDKKGDGALNFIGKKVRDCVKNCMRKFYVAKVKLFIVSYFKRYMFYKLVKRFVFKSIKRQVFFKIPRGHNSMESAKRWRKKRRK